MLRIFLSIPFKTLCLLILLTAAVFNSAHASVQEAQFLRTVAEQYILAQFQNLDPNTKVEVEAARLDDRRDYGGKCQGYLTAELRGSDIKTSSQVKITCSQPGNEYSLYLPVRVKMLTRTLVAATNLTRGSVIQSRDLKEAWLSSADNATNAVADPNVLVGSKLKKDVKAGEQIRSNVFCVIAKNDKVNIIARSHGLALKTAGQALQEGNINESIRVKNLKSGKVIYAVVIAPNTVQVVF